MAGQAADLLVRNARLVATCDDAGRELAGGWVAVTGGIITGVGTAGEAEPAAAQVFSWLTALYPQGGRTVRGRARRPG